MPERFRFKLERDRQEEIIGLLLLTLGGVTLLSLLGVTRGALSSWWADLLRQVAGWGALAIALFLLAAGLILVSHGFRSTETWPWVQVIGAELALAGALGLTHLVVGGAQPLAVARAGGGGGYVGWALSQMLVSVAGTPVAFIILGLVTVVGLGVGIWSLLQGLLSRLAQQPVEEPQPVQWEGTEHAAEVQPEVHRVRETKGKGAPVRRRRARADRRQTAPAPQAEGLPPLDILEPASPQAIREADIRERARIIEETLASFGVPARVVSINQGPTVTQFGVEPGFIERRRADGTVRRRKVRVSRITALADDLALALAAAPIRIEAPVPGQPVVGIEVPNRKVSLVSLRSVIESEAFQEIDSPLKIALGQDVSGEPVAADLALMPHLLIAGATGSGKSVCTNSIITCLLMHNPPETLKLLLVDPKRVELVNFNGIPHLLAPVVTELDEVVSALYWATQEMERRFELFAKAGVRNIEVYNRKVARSGQERLPYLVIIIDELADLMMVAPDEVERLICRLAQLARATGIHLVIATQRPSVDVVTGLIKANFPARISFAVASQVDSRVILDMAGAEKLLGRGDMLFMSPDSAMPQRLQGCYVSDKELNRLVRFWRRARRYELPDSGEEPPWEGLPSPDETADELLQTAIELVQQHRRASASFLQRRLHIGYPRAARLIDLLEEMGIVGPPAGPGQSREVIIQSETAISPGAYPEQEDAEFARWGEENL